MYYRIGPNLKIMRKLAYLFILLIIASFPVKSQTINNSNDLAGGWIKNPPNDENYIEGTRNLYDDFRRGTIYYSNSVDLNVPLRLNLVFIGCLVSSSKIASIG